TSCTMLPPTTLSSSSPSWIISPLPRYPSRCFIQTCFEGEFGVGIVHVHDFSGQVPSDAGRATDRNIIESPELVRDRLLHATKIVGDPGKIWANPDCGLRTRTWDVTYAKLESIVKGAELAREASQ